MRMRGKLTRPRTNCFQLACCEKKEGKERWLRVARGIISDEPFSNYRVILISRPRTTFLASLLYIYIIYINVYIIRSHPADCVPVSFEKLRRE